MQWKSDEVLTEHRLQYIFITIENKGGTTHCGSSTSIQGCKEGGKSA
jgi:hypothetical protein